MNQIRHAIILIAMACCVVSGVTQAETLQLSWQSLNSGGALHSTSGGLSLSGTVGQSLAGPTVAGGDLRLTGGFLVVATPVCTCPSDVNDDGRLDAADIQYFVDCLVATGPNCACADVDGVPGLDMNDVAAFVEGLITGAACP